MMDAVYMVRPGQVEELRYSLRSLAAHVEHDRVWIFGSAPAWVDRSPSGVRYVPQPKLTTKYATTTSHIRAMCTNSEVSDPFVLWMDDVYAVRPVGAMPRLHLGPLDERLKRYVSLRSAWAQGMRATAELLRERFPGRELISYEAHVPLVVHKAAMLEALEIAKRMPVQAPHKRTIYGNVAELGGIELTQDPKWVSQSAPAPKGAWLSSDDASFRSLTKPVLRWLFPDPCPYEAGRGRVPGARGSAAAGRVSARERVEARREALAQRRGRAARMRPVPASVRVAEQDR